MRFFCIHTFTLTTSADSGASFTGGAPNDTFVGALFARGSTGTTINAGDNLAGGGGTDTLLIAVTGDIDTTADATDDHYTITAVSTNAVERIVLSNFEDSTDADANVYFNAATATGLTTVGLTASGAEGDTVFNNLGNVVDAVMGNGSGDLTVTYLSTLLTGTADSQKLTVSNISAGTFTVGNGATGYAETLSIVSDTASNTLAVANNSHKTINVSGDKNLTLTVNDGANTITKVDASAFTGNLSISGFGTTDISIVGGSGNDTVTAANLTAADTIDGGAGTGDTFKSAAAVTAANAAKVSNFETLEISGDGVTQAANALSGLTGLSVNDTTAGSANGTITFSSASGSETLFVKSVGDATDDVALTKLADTASDSVTVTLGTTTAGVAFDDLTLNDAETITINNNVGTSTVATLISGDATKLVISASKTTTITDALSAANLGTIDASASTGAITVVAATAKASNITGGSGNDVFTGSSAADTMSGGAGDDAFTGNAGADSIIGGAGNDTVTAGAGNDVVDLGDGDDTINDAAADLDSAATETASVLGGAGNDTFIVADFSDLSNQTTINGGDGTDKLQFTEAANHDFTASTTMFSNITSVETLEFAMTGNRTVTINDANIFSGAVNVVLAAAATGTNTFNMSGVLASSNTINFSTVSGAGATTYSLGNGVDKATLTSGNDTFTVTNSAFLTASDVINGGGGSDTLTFSSTTNSTITTAQLAGVSNTETFSVSTGGAGNYVFTLNDAIVGANVATGATFTVSRAAADTNTATLRVDGSAVTSNYKLALTGQSDATIVQTLTGGAGDDTITGGAGADSLTGGAGNDTFTILATNGVDIITDMNFGTSTTQVDIINVAARTLSFTSNDYDTFGLVSAGYSADVDVYLFDTAAYADASALDTALEALSTANSGANKDLILIWQDSLGRVNVATAVGADGGGAGADGGDEYTTTNVARLDGITITGISSLVNVADFVVA